MRQALQSDARSDHAARATHGHAGRRDPEPSTEPGEPRQEALRLVHAPGDESADGGELAGHLHPVRHLRDRRADALRVPVFWLRGMQLTLPAFGSVTGGYAVNPRTGDRVFAVGPDQVVELATG